MIEKKTISDDVYDAILENIVQLVYTPGEKLSEAKLAAELGVSRAPIKAALSKLQNDGFVQIRPQYGTFVSKISEQRAENICTIRETLEIMAVKKAVKKISDKQLDEIGHMFKKLDSMKKFTEEKKQLIYQTDAILHKAIYDASDNEIISEVINRYAPEIKRIQRANITWDNRKDDTQEEMKKIFNALVKRDEREAVAAMKEHISNIMKTIKMVNKREAQVK